MTALAIAGWMSAALAVGLLVTLRRRLEATADAEHELRGPLAALSLALESSRLGRLSDAELRAAMDSQMDRALHGLAELAAARTGREKQSRSSVVRLDDLAGRLAAGWEPVARASGRLVRLDWAAGPVSVRADPGRLAQALGNILSNAVEHGDGRVTVRARRRGAGVRLEVASSGGWGRAPGADRRPGRGRGLAIAARAVEDAGGSLAVAARPSESELAIELPLDES